MATHWVDDWGWACCKHPLWVGQGDNVVPVSTVWHLHKGAHWACLGLVTPDRLKRVYWQIGSSPVFIGV